MALEPDPRAPLSNVTSRRGFDATDVLMRLMPRKDRAPGPGRLRDLGSSAISRWRADPTSLPEGKPYRPASLAGVATSLETAVATVARPMEGPSTPAESSRAADEDAAPGRHYTVRRGDTLRAIAVRAYGHADRSDEIFEANKAVLDDPDRVYPGQILFVP